MTGDRFGFSWRPELAAGVLLNRGRIDVVEVIPGEGLEAGSKQARALTTLAREMPVLLHSIELGLASTSRVDERRLARLARLIERIGPESWSEHLAFVRAGGIEIGHLAAPPRDTATVEGTLANLDAAARLTGIVPEIENIATIIDPPGSTMTEAAWLGAILRGCGNGLLLDLHNVHANAVNFGFDAREFLDGLPLKRVKSIHLAGGKWIEDAQARRRYLDDHLQAVPDPVYGLLEVVAERTSQPLTVILERDGAYPPMTELLAELDRARAAVAAGRRKRQEAVA